MTRHPDTDWHRADDGTETRWRSGLYLTVDEPTEGARRWSVARGPDAADVCLAMVTRAMVTRFGLAAALALAEEIRGELHGPRIETTTMSRDGRLVTVGGPIEGWAGKGA